jgi:ABC-2 type transport system permease protein
MDLNVQASPIMQTPVFLILFFAPVYVPLSLLRGMHGVATANPLTRLLEACRSLLAGQPVEVAIAFGVAAGLIALFALWSLGGLRRAEATG